MVGKEVLNMRRVRTKLPYNEYEGFTCGQMVP
jgi:hypothetical protein